MFFRAVETLYSFRNRAERLIALGRVVLAAFFLLAVWLAPSASDTYTPAAYLLLALYLSYAVLLVPMVWRVNLLLNRLGLITHVVDLVIFTFLIYFTKGTTSPFFAYFVFALVGAALRWQWPGVLWTAAAALAAYLGLGAYAAYVLRDPAFDLHYVIIRSVYLVVVAMLLGNLSAYEQRLRAELLKLTAWPHHTSRTPQVQEVLRTVAGILQAPRVLMSWTEGEESWRYWASFNKGEFRATREPSTALEPLVAAQLAESHFLCLDVRTPQPLVLYTKNGKWQRWQGVPFHSQLQARFNLRSALCLSLRGENIQGYLLVLDGKDMTSDDLLLGEIVARQVVIDMEQFYFHQSLHQAAKAEERIRLARELHDGLLQSLTGVALQTEAASKLLSDIQSLVKVEQQELRKFVQQLKPGGSYLVDTDFDLTCELEDLARRIERQWGLTVDLNIASSFSAEIPKALTHEIYRLVQEALVNAARHAQATLVRVEVGIEEKRIRIRVVDNGSGFPFHGHYDLATLMTQELGPVSLQGRIVSLGGGLVIDSRTSGASLEIILPLEQSEWNLPSVNGLKSFSSVVFQENTAQKGVQDDS